MGRSLTEIKESIAENLKTTFNLSASAVAEWRLWVNVGAMAVYTFELILNQFKDETETRILNTRNGTARWYEDTCYSFQNGHELTYNEETGVLGYLTDDPAARIVAVAAVYENNGTIIIQVAKMQGGELAPFSPLEKLNFENYINEIKFAGSKTNIVSTTGDLIRYDATVFYNPAYPQELITEAAAEALETYRTAQRFGGVVYPARFTDALMKISGVVTVKLNNFERKGTSDPDFIPVDVFARLEAGYFNFSPDAVLNFEPTRNLTA